MEDELYDLRAQTEEQNEELRGKQSQFEKQESNHEKSLAVLTQKV